MKTTYTQYLRYAIAALLIIDHTLLQWENASKTRHLGQYQSRTEYGLLALERGA
jgi:hypothetical protein